MFNLLTGNRPDFYLVFSHWFQIWNPIEACTLGLKGHIYHWHFWHYIYTYIFDTISVWYITTILTFNSPKLFYVYSENKAVNNTKDVLKHVSVSLKVSMLTNVWGTCFLHTAHPSLFAGTNITQPSCSDWIFPVGFPLLLYLDEISMLITDITQIWWEKVEMRM